MTSMENPNDTKRKTKESRNLPEIPQNRNIDILVHILLEILLNICDSMGL